MTKLPRRLLAGALLLLLLCSLNACALISRPVNNPQHASKPETRAPYMTQAPVDTADYQQPVGEVRLFDLDVYSTDGNFQSCLSHEDEIKDSKGYLHYDCYALTADGSGDKFLRYKLDRRYSMLSGTFYARENDGNLLWVEFYSDDTLIYITPQLSSENSRVDFTLDVSGVDYLTIKPRYGYFCSSMLNNWIITDQFVLYPGGGGPAPMEYIPQNCRLFDLDPYTTDDGFLSAISYVPEANDGAGYVHKNCYQVCCDRYGDNYIRWDLDGRYTTISGTLYTYTADSGSLWLDFYDGERYLFSTPRISPSQTSVTFSFDITGVKYLTVYPMEDSEDSIMANMWMIADPIFLSR